MGNWISVEDKLPDNGDVVIVCSDNGYYGDIASPHNDYNPISVCEYEDGIFWVQHTEYYTVKPMNVTHWMPLPNPPKQD